MGYSFVYNADTSDDDRKDDELRFEFGIFIDGTLNNKKNTETRKIVRGETNEHVIIDPESRHHKANLHKEALDYEKIKAGRILKNEKLEKPEDYTKYIKGVYRNLLDKQGTDNSYSNDYTNVARLWMCCTEDYRVYVEGMGTIDMEQDDGDGFMFGAGVTGIRGRVREACTRVVERIKAETDKPKNGKKIVSQITLDVFGFSRGAASARNFMYEVTKPAYSPNVIAVQDGYEPTYGYYEGTRAQKKYKKVLADTDGVSINTTLLVDGFMPEFGHLGYCLLEKKLITPKELERLEVVIRFVGVYDTVSSYDELGSALGGYNFDNDVAELHLNSTRFQKMVHFTAKDEHRTNFALTRINPSAKAIEKNFPGVHCDIGGAYEHGPEVVDEIGTSLKDNHFKRAAYKILFDPLAIYTKSGLEELTEELIDQHWYNRGELVINKQYLPSVYDPVGLTILDALYYEKLTGTKKLVRKDYSWIFAHFMEEFYKTIVMKPNFNLKTVEKYPIPENSFLGSVKKHLHDYVFGEGKEWEFKTDAQLEYESKEREKLDKKLKALENNKQADPAVKTVQDNLNPTYYKSKTDKILPGDNTKPEKTEPSQLKEVVIYGYSVQKALRILRHDYCHWSSTRDWFGMEPNGGFFSAPEEDRKRKFH
ncbi:phospholipase effector Tle1 domain-containing protein [Flavobacterium chilense]|uniref:Uncharacterized alpha/beta hydrolase domain n=1 Tax=Flavobacterium chilense TaxID=946677 RepID=A0A1M7FAD9_9FLAO|nr:DUF2235 domain-containing protein [Flavobacterium chilense]SHM00933.1 Uncharacterized alpha/beta hydrolase domain [Flavobacterium chilense]